MCCSMDKIMCDTLRKRKPTGKSKILLNNNIYSVYVSLIVAVFQVLHYCVLPQKGLQNFGWPFVMCVLSAKPRLPQAHHCKSVLYGENW